MNKTIKILAAMAALAALAAVPLTALAGETANEGPVILSPQVQLVETRGEVAEGSPPPSVMHGGSPSGMLLSDGKLLISDVFNKVIWQLNPNVVLAGSTEGYWSLQDAGGEDSGGRNTDTGDFVIYAGAVTSADSAGEPYGGYVDGSCEDSEFTSPYGIAPFLGGYAVTDSKLNVIRFILDGSVGTLAGSSEAGYKDGPRRDARFNNPSGIAADDAGNIYIADTGNHVIRMISADAGSVSTFAGSAEGRQDGPLDSAAFREPTALHYSGGALYVADSGNHRVCVIKDGEVKTLAGIPYSEEEEGFFSGGYSDGGADVAEFSFPQGVYEHEGNVYVADAGNNAIRMISGGEVTTLAKADSTNGDVYPISPRSMLAVGNVLFVTDCFAGIVFTVDI